MSCTRPLTAWQRKSGAITFHQDRPDSSLLKLPCGQCIGCRLRRSREWAVRCTHEAQQHKENTFLTLTYEREPYGGTLVKRHLQLFLKRLRRRTASRIRFFACGEYGDNSYRPHYHLLLFGYWPSDARPLKTINGQQYYQSETLASTWPAGFHLAGRVTPESCAYVTRYCTKKITGPAADDHYLRMVENTGELIQLEPEFAVMSRRPGIAKDWFVKYKDDVFPHDDVVFKGVQVRPPRYYDKLFEIEDEDGFSKIKAKRKESARDNHAESLPARRAAREKVQEARLKMKSGKL